MGNITAHTQTPPLHVGGPHQDVVVTMMSYYFYMISCFTIGFCSRSVGCPFLLYGVWHFVVFYSFWGSGYVSIEDFNTYYTLVAFMFSVLGCTLAVVLNVPSLFSGKRLGFTEQSVLTKGARKLETSHPAKVGWIYRVFLGFLFCVLVVASTLTFELIPYELAPLGMICAIVCLTLCVVTFFYAFRSGGRPAGVKRWQAVYVHYGSRAPSDMTADVALHLGIFYLTTSVAFCVTTVWVPSFVWWPFWTALIIFGAFLLFYVLLALLLSMSDSHISVTNDLEMVAQQDSPEPDGQRDTSQ